MNAKILQDEIQHTSASALYQPEVYFIITQNTCFEEISTLKLLI